MSFNHAVILTNRCFAVVIRLDKCLQLRCVLIDMIVTICARLKRERLAVELADREVHRGCVYRVEPEESDQDRPHHDCIQKKPGSEERNTAGQVKQGGLPMERRTNSRFDYSNNSCQSFGSLGQKNVHASQLL